MTTEYRQAALEALAHYNISATEDSCVAIKNNTDKDDFLRAE